MDIIEKLIPANFIKRNSRFSATVSIKGLKDEYVHIPNSGRLKELLIPNRQVLLLKANKNKIKRKTSYTIKFIKLENIFVSIEALGANRLFEEAINKNKIKSFKDCKVIAREKRIGLSRIDFLLQNNLGEQIFTEIKSVTLVKGNRAYFPDAPTKRGCKHIKELISKSNEGNKAAIVFVIQREDANSFSPNYEQDSNFSQLLHKAKNSGVSILAYKCHITPKSEYIKEEVPVIVNQCAIL